MGVAAAGNLDPCLFDEKIRDAVGEEFGAAGNPKHGSLGLAGGRLQAGEPAFGIGDQAKFLPEKGNDRAIFEGVGFWPWFGC